MSHIFRFPILGRADFTIVDNKIVHLESECCRGHDEKCVCGFCKLHKPYMVSAATKLYNSNIEIIEDLKKCGCEKCQKLLKDMK